MTYVRDESKVIYLSKDSKEKKTFDALEWLAAMGSHVPNKGSRWSDIMATTATSLGEGGRRRTRMDWYLAS